MRYCIKILPLFLLLLLMSCEKTETFNNTDERVGGSRVIFFPVITLKGAETIILEKGGTFSDPGATAQVGGTDVSYTTSGTVDVTTPGVYPITYTAANSEGFTSSVTRKVVVYFTEPDAAANDLSGNYVRPLNGQISVWTKVAPGVYSVFNPGGAAGTNVTVIVFNASGYNIKIPVQPAPDGTPFTSAQEVYSPGPPAQYTWQILNSGYGTALRTFEKI